jgi:hypothetical protein
MVAKIGEFARRILAHLVAGTYNLRATGKHG